MSSFLRATVILSALLAIVLISFLIAAPRLSKPALVPPRANAANAPLPAFKHIFVIVLENKGYNHVIDNRQASYITSLARQYGLASNFYGVTHPSLPNYLALTGGDTFGVTSNCTDCFVNQPNLVDQLEQAGKSWKAYMESMPQTCYVGDAPPLYRQKHNPFIYYDNIRNNPARCAKIVPFTEFAADIQANQLPDFVWITPNMCNDGHDCSVSTSDTWLKTWVSQILQSPAWKDDGALFITFDEGEKDDNTCCTYANGGQLATLVVSPLVKPGFVSDVTYTHYSLLRTIEQSWSLPLLGKADCTCSPPMIDFFVAN